MARMLFTGDARAADLGTVLDGGPRAAGHALLGHPLEMGLRTR